MDLMPIISYTITGLLAVVGGLVVFLFKQNTAEISRRLANAEAELSARSERFGAIEAKVARLELNTVSLLADIKERLARIETLLGKDRGIGR